MDDEEEEDEEEEVEEGGQESCGENWGGSGRDQDSGAGYHHTDEEDNRFQSREINDADADDVKPDIKPLNNAVQYPVFNPVRGPPRPPGANVLDIKPFRIPRATPAQLEKKRGFGVRAMRLNLYLPPKLTGESFIAMITDVDHRYSLTDVDHRYSVTVAVHSGSSSEGEYDTASPEAQQHVPNVITNYTKIDQRGQRAINSSAGTLTTGSFGKRYLQLSGKKLEEGLKKGLRTPVDGGNSLCFTVYEFDSLVNEEETRYYPERRVARRLFGASTVRQTCR